MPACAALADAAAYDAYDSAVARVALRTIAETGDAASTAVEAAVAAGGKPTEEEKGKRRSGYACLIARATAE